MRSLPLRGAWIEIMYIKKSGVKQMSLPLRGAWIEIGVAVLTQVPSSRSPCGERGLKFFLSLSVCYRSLSLPLRGAWIEMTNCPSSISKYPSRSPCGERGLKLPTRGDWSSFLSRSPCGERGLKSALAPSLASSAASLPLRGAWIEISAKTAGRY